MKLYLSSYRIPTPKELAKLVASKRPIAGIVPNAKDFYVDRARDYKIKEIKDFLNGHGYSSNLIDLRKYEKTELRKKLQEVDLIWVSGGNTFCLNEAVIKSGFNKLIREVLDTGVVYAGESAGAIIAGNSLESVELADPPEFSRQPSHQSMNLVDKYILPHADNNFFLSANQAVISKIPSDKLIALKDSEALVVNQGKMRITQNETT